MADAPRTVGPLDLHESVEHQRVVGILGGMGPWATVDLMRRILTLTPTAKDWDHLRVIVDNNVKIPSRTRSFLFGEPSPVPGMVDSINRLAAYPVDFVVIPCNSACHFLPEVRPQVNVPVIDIVEVVTRAATDRGIVKPGLLAGMVPWAGGVYKRSMNRRGASITAPDRDTQDLVAAAIEALKRMDKSAQTIDWLGTIIERLSAAGADGIILGCTEFSLAEDELQALTDLPLLQSTELLAQEVVDLGLGRRPLSTRVQCSDAGQ